MRLRATLLALCWTLSALAQTAEDTAMRAGVNAFTQGEYAAAREAFIRAAEANPQNGRAWLGLADASRRVGAVIAAEEALEKAVELAADDPEIHRGLAIYFAEVEESERAANHLAAYLRLLGPDAQAGDFAQVSRLFLDAGMAAAAEQFARSGLERGDSAASRTALGRALALAGRPHEAVEALAAAVKNDPFDEHRHWLLARLYLEQRRYSDAAAAVDGGLRYFDKSSALHFGLGLARLGQGDAKAAVDAFLTAARREPQSTWANLPLAELAAVSDARAEIEPQLREHAKQAAGSNGAVLLATALPRGNESEQLLREALEDSPGDWRARLEWGRMLEARGEREQSLEAYERAVKARPREPAPHYFLGRLAARMGREDLAKRELQLHARLAAQQPPGSLVERLLSATPGRRLLPPNAK